MNTSSLTIAICTYNRAEFLDLCLRSVLNKSAKQAVYNVLVIDNNSTDQTKEVVQDFMVEHPNLKYVFEANVGLSNARNRALQQCETKWIVFIDDDVLLNPDFIERALFLTGQQLYIFIGGKVISKRNGDAPRWLPENLNNFEYPIEVLGLIEPSFVIGANMMMQRSIAEAAGGFPTELGMKGGEIRYAEEDHLQMKLRKMGYHIAYDPELVVTHRVHPEKFKLNWHLASSYAHGRDRFLLANERKKQSVLLYKLCKSIFAAIFKRLPLSTYRLVFKDHFYWQNALIKIIHPVLYILGEMKGNRSIKSK
jgi:glycosyltransferase involved in cell wall biosynthesis